MEAIYSISATYMNEWKWIKKPVAWNVTRQKNVIIFANTSFLNEIIILLEQFPFSVLHILLKKEQFSLSNYDLNIICVYEVPYYCLIHSSIQSIRLWMIG